MTINKIEKKLVNWDTILIIPELSNNLNNYELIEISKLSKLIRKRLKSKIFSSILFNGRDYTKYLLSNDTLFSKYFKTLQNYFNNFSVEDNDEFDYWSLEVKPGIEELEGQLIGVSQYVKKFSLYEAASAGCYLLPLVNTFKNLNTLKISNCIISYIEFSSLIESLDNLKIISLIGVSLAKVPNENNSMNNIKYPKLLKELFVYNVLECSNELLPYPNEFLLDSGDSSVYSNFNLPNISIPSITALSLFNPDDSGLKYFLLTNSQLKELNTYLSILDQFKLDYIANSTALNELSITYDRLSSDNIYIPVFNSITQLSFSMVNLDLCYIIKEFCLNSSNLKRLSLALDSNDQFVPIINLIIKEIISTCNSIKELTLIIIGQAAINFNYFNLNNIEKLIIKSELITILNINFSYSNSLKNVEFEYFEVESDLLAIREEFAAIDNWKFKFEIGKIRGYKFE